jgi:outer membrane protein TolC
MKKIFVIDIILLSIVIPFLTGETQTNIYELIKIAKNNNPEIKMLQERYLATRQRITTVKTWEYPLVGFETSGTEQMYSVSQMLPFPGKLSLRSKVADNESKIAEQELNLKIIEVVTKVKKVYWDYWLINKIIEIYQENIDLMKRFLNIANTKYVIGKTTQIDVLKANTEVAQMENMLIMLEQQKISIQTELNSLLNHPPDTPLGNPEQPKQKEIRHTYKEMVELVLKNNPEIKSKEFLLRRSISALSLSKIEWYPDLMSGIKVDNMFNKIFMAQVAVPLYYKKQSSIVEMMRKEKEMAEWELQAIKINTLKKLKDLYSKYESYKKSIQIYEINILPLAQQTLEITESGYRTGKNDFLDLLDSWKRYLEYNIEYYKLIVEKQKILADLEQLTGLSLE